MGWNRLGGKGVGQKKEIVVEKIGKYKFK